MTTTASPHALAPGTRVRDYTIESVIGTGGFSIVYRALDNVLMRPVALKEYFPTMFAVRANDNSVHPHSRDEPTFRTGIVSFLNEAKLLAQFDHPALVRVYRYWEENSTAYLAMQLYEGETLREAVKQDRFVVNEANMRALFAPICDTLELLHQAKCFHRDVAPDNILLSDYHGPVLLDFGAARKAIEGTQVFTAILKPGYAPIEQYGESELKQGPWTDIYALAGVMHYALAGHAPPTAINRILKDAMPRPRENFAGKLPEHWLDAIEKGLAVRPENRPASVAEFRRLLGWDEPVVGSISVPTRTIAASNESAMPIEHQDTAPAAPAKKPDTPSTPPPAQLPETVLVTAPVRIVKKTPDEDATIVTPPRKTPRPVEKSAAIAEARHAAAPIEEVFGDANVAAKAPKVDPDETIVVPRAVAGTLSKDNANSGGNAPANLALNEKNNTNEKDEKTHIKHKTWDIGGKWLTAIIGFTFLVTGGVSWRWLTSSLRETPPTTPTIPERTSEKIAPNPPVEKTPNKVDVPVSNPKEKTSLPVESTPPPVAKQQDVPKKTRSRQTANQEIDEHGEPVTKSKRARPERCTSLIEAFQLGNNLSADDQRFFQENCR